MTEYQQRKITELARLGYTEVGKRFLSSPRRADKRYVYTFESSSKQLRAHVYPEEALYFIND